MGELHRDDIPMDDWAEIEAKLGEIFPGKKIVCVGDNPGTIPPEVQAAINAVAEAHESFVLEGLCIDCGARMEDYPPDDWGDWDLQEGWRYFIDMNTQKISAYQCPECDAQDGETAQ